MTTLDEILKTPGIYAGLDAIAIANVLNQKRAKEAAMHNVGHPAFEFVEAIFPIVTDEQALADHIADGDDNAQVSRFEVQKALSEMTLAELHDLYADVDQSRPKSDDEAESKDSLLMEICKHIGHFTEVQKLADHIAACNE